MQLKYLILKFCLFATHEYASKSSIVFVFHCAMYVYRFICQLEECTKRKVCSSSFSLKSVSIALQRMLVVSPLVFVFYLFVKVANGTVVRHLHAPVMLLYIVGRLFSTAMYFMVFVNL